MKPINVKNRHPIMIRMKPAKKKQLPLIFDSLMKNPTAFFSPTNDTTPIKKDI
jgi:hypothetical protein